MWQVAKQQFDVDLDNMERQMLLTKYINIWYK